MNREEIIRMAREVGFIHYGEEIGDFRISVPAFWIRLERFAALVAAAEREEIIQLLWKTPKSEDEYDHPVSAYEKAIRARGKDGVL